jgi:type II secretory pathway component GspD/PulD (secretin)
MRAAFVSLVLLTAGFAPGAGAQPPPGAPRSVRVFQLKNADAEKLRGVVANVFGRQGAVAVADARTNSLVVTGDGDTLEQVRKLVAKLDGPGK